MEDLQKAMGGQKDDYFETLNPRRLSDEEVQVLSPRRKVLVDLERILDVDIPATRKTHAGRDWKKASPNIANQDLYAILRGVCRKLGVAPDAARTVRPDVLQLPPGQARVYRVLDRDGGFLSVRDIAEELGVGRSTVWDHLSSMKDKLDFQVETEGRPGQGYVKMYRLPPAYQGLIVGKGTGYPRLDGTFLDGGKHV